MAVPIVAEIPPLRMSPQLLVGEPDRLVNLVRVGVDAKSPRRCAVVSPRRVLLRQRKVLPGVGPVLSNQLGRGALMGVGEDSGEFGCLAEDRIRCEHEAGQVRWDVRPGWGARVVVAVQESLVVHLRRRPPFDAATRATSTHTSSTSSMSLTSSVLLGCDEILITVGD